MFASLVTFICYVPLEREIGFNHFFQEKTSVRNSPVTAGGWSIPPGDSLFVSYLSPAPQALPQADGFSSGLSSGLSPAPHALPQAAGFSSGLSPAPHALEEISLFHASMFDSAIVFLHFGYSVFQKAYAFGFSIYLKE